MSISLIRATGEDCLLIHKMQHEAFCTLLNKYQDYDTNPGAEDLERIREKMKQSFTKYYLIALEEQPIGAIRVCDYLDYCRVSPIFILPDYQGNGYAQEAMRLAGEYHPNAKKWSLSTILQETKLCRFYEKMGYRQTGYSKTIKAGMDIVFYEKLM